MRRLLVTLVLFAPMVALADDASVLGPQTSTGAASTGSSSSLQPNGSTSLQNGGAASSVGGSQSDAQSALQRPATSDEAKLFIQGEASSSGSPTNDGLPWYANLLGLMVAVIAFGAGLWLWQRRQTAGPGSVVSLQPNAPPTPHSEASGVTEPSQKPSRPTKSMAKRRRKSRRR